MIKNYLLIAWPSTDGAVVSTGLISSSTTDARPVAIGEVEPSPDHRGEFTRGHVQLSGEHGGEGSGGPVVEAPGQTTEARVIMSCANNDVVRSRAVIVRSTELLIPHDQVADAVAGCRGPLAIHDLEVGPRESQRSRHPSILADLVVSYK